MQEIIKMNIYKRNIKNLLIAGAFILAATGCSQNSSSNNGGTGIVGVWNITKERIVNYTHGTTVQDTVVNLPTGYWTTTFTSNGLAIDGGTGARDTATYTLSGSTLHIDNNGTNGGTYETVQTLDAHNLVISYTDHSPAPPYDSVYRVFTGTR